jgi:hypothetical protein
LSRFARRLIPALIATALIAPASASAAGDSGVSHADAVRALQAAQEALGSTGAPTQLSSTSAPNRDATVALRDLAVALPALHGAERHQGTRLLARPTDKGRDYFGKEAADSPICNANFCVHWTDTKKNAPESQDFINEVVGSTDLTYAVENGTLGWKAPKSDGSLGKRNGQGGDGQVDVYITNLGRNLYGYAAPDPGQGGSKRHAYLVLDNNYVGFPSPPIESLKVTVAHEYNHILQFNYDTLEDVWMFESTATWAEQQVYPDINDYLNYLSAFAKGSEFPLTGRDIKIYAEAVWNHWLSARYGLDSVRDAWAASEHGVKPPHHATSAYTESIKSHGGGTFSTEFGEFAAATAEWNSSASFPDAAVYPDVRRKGSAGAKTQKVTLDNTSYRLAKVKATGTDPISLKVRAPHGISSAVALVGRVGPIDSGAVTLQIKQLPKGGSGTVTLDNPGGYDRITAVIVDTDGTINHRGAYVADGSKYKYSVK